MVEFLVEDCLFPDLPKDTPAYVEVVSLTALLLSCIIERGGYTEFISFVL